LFSIRTNKKCVIFRIFFQDFPGPGIFKKKIQDFPGGVGTLIELKYSDEMIANFSTLKNQGPHYRNFLRFLPKSFLTLAS